MAARQVDSTDFVLWACFLATAVVPMPTMAKGRVRASHQQHQPGRRGQHQECRPERTALLLPRRDHVRPGSRKSGDRHRPVAVGRGPYAPPPPPALATLRAEYIRFPGDRLPMTNPPSTKSWSGRTTNGVQISTLSNSKPAGSTPATVCGSPFSPTGAPTTTGRTKGILPLRKG